MSRSKTFNANNKIVKERIWIAVKLTIQNRVAEVDDEPNERSRTYSRSSRPHVRLFKKSEHEQEASNEFFGVTRRIKKNHEGGSIPSDCVRREIWTRPDD